MTGIRLPAERCPTCGAVTYIPLGAPDPVEAAEKLLTHATTCPGRPA